MKTDKLESLFKPSVILSSSKVLNFSWSTSEFIRASFSLDQTKESDKKNAAATLLALRHDLETCLAQVISCLFLFGYFGFDVADEFVESHRAQVPFTSMSN